MYFTFKGEYSYDYGITVTRSMYRVGAPYRHYITEVDGISGGTMDVHGYTSPVMYLDFVVEGEENVLKIMGWLHGKGKYTDSTYPGKYLIVDFQSEKDFEYIGDNLYKTNFSAYMDDPFWYKEDDKWEEPWGANIVPNGWDSFIPYRFGNLIGKAPEDVFDEGYSRNLLPAFTNDRWVTNGQVEHIGDYIFTPAVGSNGSITIDLDLEIGQEYTLTFNTDYMRVYFESYDENDNLTYLVTGGTNKYYTVTIPEDSSRQIILINTYSGNVGLSRSAWDVKLEKGNNQNPTWTPAWEDLPEEEKPVDVYEEGYIYKQPLENGLTRIQTWGGNDNRKLFFSWEYVVGRALSIGFYIKPKTPMFITHNNPYESQYLTIDEDNFVKFSFTEVEGRHADLLIRSRGGDLDFIASDPVVVEGDRVPAWEADNLPRIVNEGTTTSQPLIRLIKKDDEIADVTINGVRFLYDFDGEDEVIIDCREQTAVNSKGVNRIQNLAIGHTFPYLEPGATPVISNTTIQFKKKDRWV